VEKKKKYSFLTTLILGILLVIGFFYRVFGLDANYSFWTDENHVAIFVRAILERGEPVLSNGYSSGVYQWLQYWISAISASLLGLNEFAIRFPSVFFGVLTILAIYLLGKEIFNRKVSLLSVFFVTFLNIEILFSRQARPYQALQFFYLLGFYFIYKLVKEKKFNWRYFLGFLGCGILASLMHGLGLIIFFSGFVYLLIFKASYFKKKWMLLGILLFLILGYIFRVPIFSVFSQIGKTNNLFYYRVFLVHNYLLFCLTALIGGLLLAWRKNYRVLFLFSIILGVQVVIVSYFLPQPFTRYLYPIFGFIIILSAYGLESLSIFLSSIFKKNQYLQIAILILLTCLVVMPNNKFTFIPKLFYSLNADMQEVPEVDWKKVYGVVGDKRKQNPDAILVTNWSDLPVWYLGEGKPDFLVRKDVGTEKDIFSKAMILSDLNNFRELVKNKKKGLIIIDSWDDQVPDGIREFCRDNFKKELEIDRLYPTQPRYWPVSVYSWGVL